LFKFIIAVLIALMPAAGLRRALYRSVFSYQIASSARVGWLTVIRVRSFAMGEGARTGPLNLFWGPIEVDIGAGARIGRLNRFTCAWHVMQERFKSWNYTPKLVLGKNSLVLDEHFFDIYGLVSIGDGSWIAGHGSQFWTHGLSVMERDIVIGQRNYIGSAVRFAPGSGLGDDNIVGLGSVISSRITCDNHIVAGFPAKPIRSVAEDKANGKYRFTFEDWKD
jgi:hypothetical protein